MPTDEVIIGEVKPFPNCKPDKEQALKVLEEAAEVFGAWQEYEQYHSQHSVWDYPKVQTAKILKTKMFNEIADVIQACVNLLSAYGATDFAPYVEQCEQRNRDRGRYDANE